MLFKNLINNIRETCKVQDITKEEAIYKMTIVSFVRFSIMPIPILCFMCWIFGNILGEKLTVILEKFIKKEQGNEMLIIFFIALFLGFIIAIFLQYKDKKAGYDWIQREKISYKTFEKFFYRYFIVLLVSTSFAFLISFTFYTILALSPSLTKLNTILSIIELLFFTGLSVLSDRFIINSFIAKKKSE